MIGEQFGPFQIRKKLGVGGMATVYLARHIENGQRVALKILSWPENVDRKRWSERFRRELEILKRLKHPNIVRIHGAGKHTGKRYYAMEVVEGGSLAWYLRKHNRLSWEQTVEFSLQVCSALEHAHRQGIIHRDLKPANLLLTKQQKIKLGDFGLARDIDAPTLTATGKMMGTFLYMAPEQIRGKDPVTKKTDLYALGCVIFEMLTGRPPFQSESPAEVFYMHLEKKPERVSTIVMDCPIWLDSLVAQLLEKDPGKRPMDVLAVTRALHEVQEKVATQMSATKHTASGSPTSISVSADKDEVKKLVTPRRKRRKKNPDQAFYETSWFLGLALVSLIAVLTWAFWPLSEREYYERARVLMESDDPVNWGDARSKYIEPMMERFPNGSYGKQLAQWTDKIDMHRAERKHELNLRFRRDPQSEAERLYAQARDFEIFGDRVTALERYYSMVNLLKEHQPSRPFVLLAKRQIGKIESAGINQEDRLAIVSNALTRADEIYQQGQTVEAHKIWRDIVNLYEDNKELVPQVRQAQSRLDGGTRDPEPANEQADP